MFFTLNALQRLQLDLDVVVRFFPPSDLKRSDANGFVQKALDAANVYNNIAQYIEEANITGLTTMDLATRAEDVGCLKCAAVSYISYIQYLG